MSVNWTAEQIQVIESRNCNLLVSAAAGSGKTAVLVERIIRMVTEGDHPLDIDKLLVMTFTNAAAAEMRERIGAAIEQKLRETPENEHLQIQAALIHHAQITTIHSFCLNLIRNHFNRLELDPAFKIGDEGELGLLRTDVLEELLEDFYEHGGDRFERFVETYAQGKGDHGIEDYIMQVYTFSQSNPDPKQWLQGCREELGVRQEGDWKAFPWMVFWMEDFRRQIAEWKMQMSEALDVCEQDEYLCAYVPMFTGDLRQLTALLEAADFETIYQRLLAIAWDRLATVRSKEVDPETKAYVTGCRDRMKKALTKMREAYCFASPAEMMKDLAGTDEAVGMLLDLTEEFDRRYQEKKRDRNVVDFNDLEHEALRVLIDRLEGEMTYTEVADELSAQYEEVLVDEYQDSNLVQETLLHAVSRERFGHPNIFMVGDVKQSIYKFRLARPELFLEKYQTYVPYGTEKNLHQKIELHQNFRSRKKVLEGINSVFYKVMTSNLGNIRYTHEAALHPGASFAETKGNIAGIPELLTVDTGSASLQQLDEDAADYTSKEIEAKLIAANIRKMTDPTQGLLVWDKKQDGAGGYRIARYRDIVILLRSTSGWVETLMAVLMNEGIPAYAESRTGYFDTIEVQTVLSMLSLIDNPVQDIPLAAVLKSPIGAISDTELAMLMAEAKASAVKGQDRGLYGAMMLYLQQDRDDMLFVKLNHFWNLLTDLRQKNTYLLLHELIYRVYEITGYYDYVSAMPAGETRRANLDILVEKASAYEQTSYKGLFHFIRYVEKLKKYNTDFGEASTLGEEDDTIRIMSIHKSKGLEFPVVILAGMGKKFNKQDVYGKILIDPELGIGTDYLDLENRLKTTTIKKNVLRRKMELDNLGEELRVLYVAMTRAKEKLVMTGTDRYLSKSLEKYAQIPLVDGQIPYTILSAANSYLDWVLMGISGGNPYVKMKEVPLTDIVGEELIRQVKNRKSKEELLTLDLDQVYDEKTRDEFTSCLGFRYPYEIAIRLHTKMSVTELKKQGQMIDEAESVRQAGPIKEVEERVAANDGYGATRGTAYHRAMELLPFDQIHSEKEIEAYLLRMVEEKHFSRESYELLEVGPIWTFLQSPLGQRMSQAQQEGRLYKEKQFVMGIPARELGAGDSDELIVVQGIIDAYLEEEGQLVLMDYKTDRIRSTKTLIDHYGRQLDYYQRALEQMTGKTVKEKIIYSMTLGQEILC